MFRLNAMRFIYDNLNESGFVCRAGRIYFIAQIGRVIFLGGACNAGISHGTKYAFFHNDTCYPDKNPFPFVAVSVIDIVSEQQSISPWPSKLAPKLGISAL